MYDEARDRAGQIEAYEQEIVDKYNAMDLYRNKGKSWSKISFNDLSLEENLNYIKYNLKSSHEAYKLFLITQDKFQDQPLIPAQIIQKMAKQSNINKRNFDEKMFRRIEYKAMLKVIKNNLDSLDNKMLVDTIFSLG